MKTFDEIKKTSDKEEILNYWLADCDDELFRPLVEKAVGGNNFAQQRLAFYYQMKKAKLDISDEKGKKECQLKSAYWTNKAADNGNAEAQSELNYQMWRNGH